MGGEREGSWLTSVLSSCKKRGDWQSVRFASPLFQGRQASLLASSSPESHVSVLASLVSTSH